MGRPCRTDCRRCGRRGDAGVSAPVLVAPGQPAVLFAPWTRGTTARAQESDSSPQRDWTPQPWLVQVPRQVWRQGLLLRWELQLGGKLIFFVCLLYNACVGYCADSVPCQIPCLPGLYSVRVNSVQCGCPCPFRPYLFILCAVSIPAMPVYCTCRVLYVPCTCRVHSGPTCCLQHVLKFFVSLLPPKNLGEV